jgi:uncharacterized protein (TIGR04552 family)
MDPRMDLDEVAGVESAPRVGLAHDSDELVRLADLTLADVEAMRCVLSGASVIDWRRLHLRTRDEVAEFLRVQGFHPDEEDDRARLWALHARAVQYLEMSFGLRLPRAILFPPHLEDIFLWASHQDLGSGAEIQRAACTLLKVMHIVHHIDARELGFLVPLSDRQIFALAEEKVLGTFDRLAREGFPIVEAVTSRKLKDSVITKLLAKRENLAAQIFDKLRVRIVTAEAAHVLPVLRTLTRVLFPFNYVLPGESRNRLVDLRARIQSLRHLRDELGELQQGCGLEVGERPGSAPANEFSGHTYRDIAFVLDLPIRLPDATRQSLEPSARALGPIVFTLVEFQLLDEATHIANERGDGSHEAYKHRQQLRVLERLAGKAIE